MAFFAQLQSQLKSRRDYVDAASTVASGQGEGIRLADVGAPGGHKFFSFRDFQDGSATGYRGLRNQGATCYLNSMLQALYLTHGFRRAVYAWRHDPDVHPPVAQCPAAQLQRLFARLQLSDRAAVSTTPLTKSFGWNDREVFAQQDVQEMMSVLLTNMEESGLAACVRDEFTGVFVSYIDFIGTPHARERQEAFRDVQLTIKGTKSVEEALQNFVEPEVMEGDNMIMCEALGGKASAHKGLRFAEMPPVLTLQLKRFGMDWQRMCQVKLADEVAIPMELNPTRLGLLSRKGGDGGDGVNGDEDAVAAGEGKTPTSGESPSATYDLYAVLVHNGGAMGGHYFSYMRDLLPAPSSALQKMDDEAETGWLNFNDAKVTALSREALRRVLDVPHAEPKSDVKITDGDSIAKPQPTSTPIVAPATAAAVKTNKKNELVRSSSNAYMLMYRRRSTGSAANDPILDSEVPEEIAAEIAKDNKEYGIIKAAFRKEQNTYSLRIFKKNTPSYTVVKVNCNETLQAVTRAVHASLFSSADEYKGESTTSGAPSLGRVRLRQYDTLHNIATAPLDPSDDTTTIKEAGVKRTYPLWLEVRGPGDETFSTWTETTVALSVRLFNPAGTKDARYHEPAQIDVQDLATATVGDLRTSIASALGIPGGAQRCRMIVPHAAAMARAKGSMGRIAGVISGTRPASRHKVLSDDSARLGGSKRTDPEEGGNAVAGLGFVQGTEILVEECEDFAADVGTVDESSSNILRELESAAAAVILKFNVPGEDRPSLELSIDSRLSLLELKQAIASHAKMVELGMNDLSLFKIRRTASSEEWKDLALVMTTQGLRDKSSIFVEKGTPLLPTQVSIVVNRYHGSTGSVSSGNAGVAGDESKTASGGDLAATGKARSWTLMGHLIVEKDTPVSALKQAIVDQWLTDAGSSAVASRLRIRECGEYALKALLHDAGTLSSCIKHVNDGTEIAFRELDADEELGVSALVLSLARWFPGTGVLAPAFPYQEMIIPNDTWTVEDLRNRLSKDIGIDVASVSLAKPFSWELKDLSVIPKLKWDKFPPRANLIQDLRLQHGNVIVFKDNSVAEVVTAGDAHAAETSRNRGGGGGIKIYSYAEQVERAAEKQINDANLQSEQDQARQDAEERLAAAKKRGGMNLNLAASFTVRNKCRAASAAQVEACTNAKCKCSECTCGSGCSCGVSMDVVCDPCVDFKKAMMAKKKEEEEEEEKQQAQ
jgi:ubiquitin C-terminal hydrolase